MINFADLNYREVKDIFSNSLNLDKKNISMRSNQVWKFYYQKGYFDLNLFSNLPEEILKKLKKEINFERPKIKSKQISNDGTIKWLLELNDKNLIENLSANEIISQILIAKDELNDWEEQKKINNIVYMGMGEPFYNFENIKKSVEILKDENGLNFSNKKITVSTSGISPNIKKAADELGTYLALSLHAPNNEIRNEIMPINKKYNIQDVIDNCNEYAKKNGEKIFIEYVLLKDVNDSEKCAKELSKIMSRFPSKLNVIQFNPWPGVKYLPSTEEQTAKFIEIIKNNGHIVTLRKSRGDDILGACGQLKTASEREKKLTLSK